MNYLKFSFIPIILLIVSCGNDTKSSTPSSNEVTTVAKAEKNYSALSRFKSLDLTKNVSTASSKSITKLMQNKLTYQKGTSTNACRDGGSITTIENDADKATIIFNNCQSGGELANGKVIIIVYNTENIKMIFEDYTVKQTGGTKYINIAFKISIDSNKVSTLSINGVINQTLNSGEKNNIDYRNFVIKSKNTYNDRWSTIDGRIGIESKCDTGTYTFQTIEKLVSTRNGKIEFGILKLNGATYTFDNPYVTIKAGSEEETILQSELTKRTQEQNSNCQI